MKVFSVIGSLRFFSVIGRGTQQNGDNTRPYVRLPTHHKRRLPVKWGQPDDSGRPAFTHESRATLIPLRAAHSGKSYNLRQADRITTGSGWNQGESLAPCCHCIFGVGEKVVVVGCLWSCLLLEACGSLLGLEFLLD